MNANPTGSGSTSLEKAIFESISWPGGQYCIFTGKDMFAHTTKHRSALFIGI